MNEEEYRALRQFFGCYFHEDWHLDEPDATSVIKTYLQENSTADIAKVALELEDLLKKVVDDKMLDSILLWGLNCRYNPGFEQKNSREWLSEVLKKLRLEILRRSSV